MSDSVFIREIHRTLMVPYSLKELALVTFGKNEIQCSDIALNLRLRGFYSVFQPVELLSPITQSFSCLRLCSRSFFYKQIEGSENGNSLTLLCNI